jgi:lycopene cyclase domain-containing protein
VVLFFVGLTQIPRLYTSVTFISLAVFLSVVIIKGATWLPMFLLTFLVIQLPFFISNGILTGSFLGRTVVWYSPAHNMGLRMLTIPVEDVFYGMLLLVMNVAGMEWRRNANQISVK